MNECHKPAEYMASNCYVKVKDLVLHFFRDCECAPDHTHVGGEHSP